MINLMQFGENLQFKLWGYIQIACYYLRNKYYEFQLINLLIKFCFGLIYPLRLLYDD